MDNTLTPTLSFADTIQRIGYTVIDETRVCQYTCNIPSDHPENMRIVRTKMNEDLYRDNLDVCLADYAAFEKAAYEIQAKYLVKSE